MATILDVLENFRSINLKQALPGLVNETKQEIIRLNQQQLFSGLLSTGDKVGVYKLRDYAERKNLLNPLPGFGIPDLKLSGDFYKGFVVEVNEEIYNITSRDPKTGRLYSLFGPDIFGLTEENKGLYSQGILGNAIRDFITAKTGLLFG